MTLTTKYLAFRERVRKEFGYAFIAIIAFGIYCYCTDANLAQYFLFAFVVMTVLTILVFTKAWHLVHTVQFLEEKIIIEGDTINTPWRKEFDIKTSTIEIRSKSNGRYRVEYILRITSGDQSQDINRTFNWDYTSLLTIFHEFKRIKGEKIIYDEKYYLDIMEKKAKRLSTSIF